MLVVGFVKRGEGKQVRNRVPRFLTFCNSGLHCTRMICFLLIKVAYEPKLTRLEFFVKALIMPSLRTHLLSWQDIIFSHALFCAFKKAR